MAYPYSISPYSGAGFFPASYGMQPATPVMPSVAPVMSPVYYPVPAMPVSQVYPAPAWASMAYALPGYAPMTPSYRYIPPFPSPIPSSPTMPVPQNLPIQPPPEAPVIAAPAPKEYQEVRASHILVKDKAEAEAIRQRILSGKSTFEQEVKASTCPSKENGGDLGFFEHGKMVPEFDKAAFSLPRDVLSEPVKTDFGWHLIKITDQR